VRSALEKRRTTQKEINLSNSRLRASHLKVNRFGLARQSHTVGTEEPQGGEDVLKLGKKSCPDSEVDQKEIRTGEIFKNEEKTRIEGDAPKSKRGGGMSGVNDVQSLAKGKSRL